MNSLSRQFHLVRLILTVAFYCGSAYLTPVAMAQSGVPQTQTSSSTQLQNSVSGLGQLGSFLQGLLTKAWFFALLIILVGAIVGAIMWLFGQRAMIINVFVAVCIVAAIILAIGQIADLSSNT